MATKVFVVPAPGYEHLIDSIPHAHPGDGVLREGGTWWTEDHFTMWMLRDGVIKLVEDQKPKVVESASPDAVFKGGKQDRKH